MRRDLRRRRWGELHRRLAAQPVFAACSRQEIRFIARWGDEVSAEPGCVLWREDTIGHHFVVVEAGELTLTHKGRRVARLGPGGYAGDVAIVSWAPQGATLRTTTSCQLFVIGRAALLSLVHMPGVRAGLLGVLDEETARDRLRSLRAAGLSEWQRRSPSQPETSRLRPPTSLRFYPPAGEPSATSWPRRPDRQAIRPGAAAAPMSRRLRVAVAIAAVAAVLVPGEVVLRTARLQVGVVRPARPIEVTSGVTVAGAPTTPIHGRYILVAVRISRPTLAEWVPARLRHDTTVRLAADQEAAAQASRASFADAQRNAVSAVESVLAWDPAKLRMTMRPLAVTGSSVGLIYALTIADLLDPRDLARGRTIAATGQIDADGRVEPVRFLAEKARVARAAGATLFLVPPGQAPDDASMQVIEVATLADALKALRATS